MKISRKDFWELVKKQIKKEDRAELVFVVCMCGLSNGIIGKSLKEILEEPEKLLNYDFTKAELKGLIESIEIVCHTPCPGDTSPGKCYINSPFGFMEIDNERPYVIWKLFYLPQPI